MTTVGSGEHTFEAVYDWAKLPDGWDAPMAAVAVDSQDRVYGFNRGERGVIVFDKDGNYVSHWADADFVFPHAIYADPSDNIWIVDRDAGQILKYTPEGELLLAIGERGHRSDTGADNSVFSSDGWRDVTRGGGPFNLPAGVAVAPERRHIHRRRIRQLPGSQVLSRRATPEELGRTPEAARGSSTCRTASG